VPYYFDKNEVVQYYLRNVLVIRDLDYLRSLNTKNTAPAHILNKAKKSPYYKFPPPAQSMLVPKEAS
jgi:hypothetical protein